MTSTSKSPPLYPKAHIIAASGVAALLSLALLVFPSREVEAKRTDLSFGTNVGDERTEQDAPLLPEEISQEVANNPSPFSEAASANDTLPKTETQAGVEPNEKIITVARGDTLSTIFQKAGIPNNLLHNLLEKKNVQQFSHLKVGQVLHFKLDQNGQLQSLYSPISELESIHLSKTESGYAFKHEQLKPDVREAYAHGVIDSSLFLSAKHAGLSHNLTMDLASIFGYDIDFAMDIRQGDEFDVIYQEKTVNGKAFDSGHILSARFINQGKTYTAVRYTDKQGNVSYYDAAGNSLRKAFIRTPVDFARISSRFSNGRKHPILNKIRAHKGVDYAAPRGTPIKAAGDGKVVLAGRKGGYGNTIILQHGNRYRTLYAHMQGFAKGIRTGGSVRQGQIIGYIGTTGLSTGPHLHYEFQVNGTHVDPLSQKLPMSDPIARSEKQRFLQSSNLLMTRMDQKKTTSLALKKQ
jgi:murein DD-endopeptidase MepM/ murein hydrolase activator NlpD